MIIYYIHYTNIYMQYSIKQNYKKIFLYKLLLILFYCNEIKLLNLNYDQLNYFSELVNSLQGYSFEDRSHVNIISTMREAKNYLSKINNIDFDPSIDPNAILKYFKHYFMHK